MYRVIVMLSSMSVVGVDGRWTPFVFVSRLDDEASRCPDRPDESPPSARTCHPAEDRDEPEMNVNDLNQ